METLPAITEQTKKQLQLDISRDMSTETRTFYARRWNKVFSLDYPVGYSNQHRPRTGRRAKRPNRFDNNGKGEGRRLRVNSINKLFSPVIQYFLFSIFFISFSMYLLSLKKINHWNRFRFLKANNIYSDLKSSICIQSTYSPSYQY